MRFRAALLIFSTTIIGFCLTLYFQSEQTVQTMNWDEYTNLQYNEDRSHSLEDLNQKIAPYDMQEIIQNVHDKNKLAGQKTRIMEVGSGNGRVIMELKKLFPQVEFYGINKEKTHTFYRRESFILTALKFGIFTKPELENLDLPYVVFQDIDFGTSIPYDEDKFDVIFSQNTLRHIKYKFELFNEIMRVLKPGGVSLHTDLPPVHVYDKGVVLDFKDALGEMRKKGIHIAPLENPRSLMFKKEQDNVLFPVVPHHPLPTNTDGLSQEMRRPDMGYNLRY